MKNRIFLFLTIQLFFIIQVYSQISFPLNSSYKYLKGSEANSLDNSWISSSFDDIEWPNAFAPFRYGDGSGGAYLVDMPGRYSSLYLRSTFIATNTDSIKEITFNINYDDGFVFWLNGVEIIRRNAPAVLSNTAFATQSHESGILESIILPTEDLPILEGENQICIQALNVSLESTDFYFDMEIKGEIPLPEHGLSLEEGFSHPAGLYYTPFNLTITSTDVASEIAYTIDGSDPINSESAILSSNVVNIDIDPQTIVNRPTTPAVIVRAAILKNGFHPSATITKTYIFPERVKTQSYPGGSWPSSNLNGQLIDLDISSEVANDPQYANNIVSALNDIPSISVVTDMPNMFDASTGIYVNAWADGKEWERPCSIEVIDPEGLEGVQSNAGIRIRGGYSRSSSNPKHSFRLFFRGDYGNSKLSYSLFGNEGASEFEKIDLRTAQNYSWSFEHGLQNTFVRDVFSRDSQRDMGRPYTRSRYYHLYLNGMYWGLYQTQERSEARYAAEYFGGEADDYDVVKVDAPGGYIIEATDGNLEAWNKVYNLCLAGFSSDTNYYMLQGKDSYGNSLIDNEVLVDIDNLIDYMLVIFYTGNTDSPISKGLGNDSPNNFYAIFNRADKSKGFMFFVHDAEHSMLNLYEDRVNLGDDVSVSAFNKFNPHWLHEKLSENAEYRQRFADRALLHFSGSGVLSPNACQARFLKRVNEIEMAIVGESLRWGDVKGTPARTKDDWLKEINNVVNNYLSTRTSIVIEQMKKANLYSPIKSPQIKRYGETLTRLNYPVNSETKITLSNPNSEGFIYYTLNEDDPRLLGGGISNKAMKVELVQELSIDKSTSVKARAYINGQWSALREINFNNYSRLKVTELHYHPDDMITPEGNAVSGKSYEFIELKNTDSSAMDLSGLVIDSAVYYKFPLNSKLESKGFYVIATKPKYFAEYYGMEPSGNCSGFFSNSGEHIVLSDPYKNKIFSFTYLDNALWPTLSDGGGHSLTAVEVMPTGNPELVEYWRASSSVGGSPFSDDYIYVEPTENMTISLGNRLKVYPNPSKGRVTIGSVDNNFKEQEISIINLNGSVVYKTFIHSGKTLNLNNLGISKGVYIIKVVEQNNIYQEKIIYN